MLTDSCKVERIQRKTASLGCIRVSLACAAVRVKAYKWDRIVRLSLHSRRLHFHSSSTFLKTELLTRVF